MEHGLESNVIGLHQGILLRSPTHALRSVRLSQLAQSLRAAAHGLCWEGVRGLMLLLPLGTRTRWQEVHRMVSLWTSFAYRDLKGCLWMALLT